MKKNWSPVEVLRHSRHDWLNNLQLIKGNIDLNKIDRVKEIIQEIVMNSQYEAKLTNLNMPNFSNHLLTYNWEKHHFQIEFEVLGEVKDLSTFDIPVSDWTISFFQILDQAVAFEGENHLSISIELGKNQICFFFDFSGIIKEIEKLHLWLTDNKENAFLEVIEKSVLQQEMSIVLNLK